MIKCALQSGGTLQIEYNCYFLRRPENWSIRRKTSTRSKDENQQQTQPTYDAESRNRTQATIGGRRVLSLHRQKFGTFEPANVKSCGSFSLDSERKTYKEHV